MKAMILAAGLGKRMRPLTDNTPKPLLEADGKALIHYHLEALNAAGIQEVVINTHWCASQLEQALGSGSRWNLHIHYSHEPKLLETAGGILQALTLMNLKARDQFIVINGDIFCDLPIHAWLARNRHFDTEQIACLAMVENPDHHPAGDFALHPDDHYLRAKTDDTLPAYTYAGLALFEARFFHHTGIQPGQPLALAPLLHQAISKRQVKGDLLANTTWMDIGTPARLEALSRYLQQRKA